MISNNTSAHKHVAVLTFPFSSHAGVLFTLLGRLAGAAPGVQFSFFSTAKENSSLFSVPTPRNVKAFDVSEGVPEGYVFEGRHAEDIELFLKAAPENFRLRVRAAEDEMGMKVSCVVADAFLWFSAEMAEEMRVPWLPLWTSGAAPLAVHVYTDFIRQTVGVGTTDANAAGRNDEIVKFIPGFSEVKLADLPTGVIFGNFDSPFSIMLHKMGQSLPRATAVSINSFQELDLPITQDLRVNKFQKFLHIGPFNLTSPPLLSNSDEHGCIRWLDNQRPASVVYIGFGTVATPPPLELKALAEAVEENGSPFLWSLKDNLKCHLPEGFLERTSNYGKVEPWVPQVMVLSHSSVGVFISHCGWSSVMESIAAGVPMIGRPFFGDQQLNTWMIERVWKIGVRVEDGVFTKSGVTSAIGLVLSHEKGKIMKERVKMYKGLAFKAVGPNGSSTENFKALLGIITL